MTERVQTINELVEEKPGFRLEDFPQKFNEMELLGLDEPRYELTHAGQSLKVPKLVYFLFEVPGASEKLTKYFELNIEEDNFGKVSERESVRANLRKRILLIFLGVRSGEREGFFTAGTNGRQSESLKDKKLRLDILRETYPFRNPNEFPKIHELLEKIKNLTGLDTKQLFGDYIPTPFLWRAQPTSAHTSKGKTRPILLEQHLEMIVGALSGRMTGSQIGRNNKRDRHAVPQHLERSTSEELLEQIRKRMLVAPSGTGKN